MPGTTRSLPQKLLIVQRDHTVLLRSGEPDLPHCTRRIARFAELVKSPELSTPSASLP
jgi:hypothetical protein